MPRAPPQGRPVCRGPPGLRPGDSPRVEESGLHGDGDGVEQVPATFQQLRQTGSGQEGRASCLTSVASQPHSPPVPNSADHVWGGQRRVGVAALPALGQRPPSLQARAVPAALPGAMWARPHLAVATAPTLRPLTGGSPAAEGTGTTCVPVIFANVRPAPKQVRDGGHRGCSPARRTPRKRCGSRPRVFTHLRLPAPDPAGHQSHWGAH